MSKLEQLIEQLCPNGVEFLPLWSVTIWDKKFNSVDRSKQNKVITYPYLLASQLFSLEKDGGDVFLLSTGEQTGWTTVDKAGKYLCKGEVVTIPWGKSRAVVDCIKYYNGKFVTADNRIMTSNNIEILNNKYLYYWIMSMGKVIDTFYRGSGIKHPDMAKVLDMRIPIPPLKVQAEIVRILDKFTELTTELTTELATELADRKKQYEYYRDELLRFDSTANKSQIGDLCNIIVGGDVPKEHYSKEKSDTFSIPIISNGIGKNAIYGYTNIVKVNQSAVTIAARGTIGYAEYRDYPYYPIIRLLSVIPKNNGIINTKYLYYCLQGRMYKVPKTGIPQLTVPMLKKEIICVPTLETQNHIVSVLDRFDKLCNDISEGLPAEIEARQKQYEYYRDKLLTFSKKSED